MDIKQFKKNLKGFQKQLKKEFFENDLFNAEYEAVASYFVERLNEYMRKHRKEMGFYKFKTEFDKKNFSEGKKFSSKIIVKFLKTDKISENFKIEVKAKGKDEENTGESESEVKQVENVVVTEQIADIEENALDDTTEDDLDLDIVED